MSPCLEQLWQIGLTVFNAKPRAKLIKKWDGRVTIGVKAGQMRYNIPIAYQVRWGRRSKAWILSRIRIVGTRHPSETPDDILKFRRFDEALKAAKYHCQDDFRFMTTGKCQARGDQPCSCS